MQLSTSHRELTSTPPTPTYFLRQPGFTVNERNRFSNILKKGGLVDTWRHLHPVPPSYALNDSLREHDSTACPHLDPAGPNFTWRGAAGVNGVPKSGIYYEKAMRLDYALVSEALLPRVVSCEILGQGRDRQGFLGSDHCPIMLTLVRYAPCSLVLLLFLSFWVCLLICQSMSVWSASLLLPLYSPYRKRTA